MRRFLWAGMPSDIQTVLEAFLAVPGIRFVLPDTENGELVSFTKAGPDFWTALKKPYSHVHIAGTFTVDLQLSAERIFVIEHTGPLLYLRLPWVFSNGSTWRSSENPKPPVEIRDGFLGIHGTYYFSTPTGHAGPSPRVQIEAAYKNLIKVAKKSLVKHEGRWVGKTAKEWLESKKATYRKE